MGNPSNLQFFVCLREGGIAQRTNSATPPSQGFPYVVVVMNLSWAIVSRRSNAVSTCGRSDRFSKQLGIIKGLHLDQLL